MRGDTTHSDLLYQRNVSVQTDGGKRVQLQLDADLLIGNLHGIVRHLCGDATHSDLPKQHLAVSRQWSQCV